MTWIDFTNCEPHFKGYDGADGTFYNTMLDLRHEKILDAAYDKLERT